MTLVVAKCDPRCGIIVLRVDRDDRGAAGPAATRPRRTFSAKSLVRGAWFAITGSRLCIQTLGCALRVVLASRQNLRPHRGTRYGRIQRLQRNSLVRARGNTGACPASISSSGPPGCRTMLLHRRLIFSTTPKCRRRRYPDKPYLVFFETPLTFAAVQGRSRASGRLSAAGLRRAQGRSRAAGDAEQSAVHRFLLRASCAPNAIVVPVNPMSVTAELEHYVQDSGAQRRTRSPRKFIRSSSRCRREARARRRRGLLATT